MPNALLFSIRKALLGVDAADGENAEADDIDRELVLFASTSCLSVSSVGAATSFSRLTGGSFGTKILCVFQEPWRCGAKISLESGMWLYASGFSG